MRTTDIDTTFISSGSSSHPQNTPILIATSNTVAPVYPRGCLDKFHFKTNLSVNKGWVSQNLSKEDSKFDTHYLRTTVYRMIENPDSSVIIHEFPKNPKARKVKVELNPAKYLDFRSMESVIANLFQSFSSSDVLVDRVDFAVDFLESDFDWYSLKKIVRKPKASSFIIYDNGFAYGKNPRRLQVYRKCLDNQPVVTRIELQISGDCFGINTLEEFGKLSHAAPFTSEGIEYLELRPPTKSIDDVIKTKGLERLLEYYGSMFHLRQYLDSTGNFSRYKKYFAEHRTHSAAKLDAILAASLNTWF